MLGMQIFHIRYKFHKDETTFSVNQYKNCATSKMGYEVYCNACKDVNCAGETGTIIYEKFHHISSMKCNDNGPIGKPF